MDNNLEGEKNEKQTEIEYLKTLGILDPLDLEWLGSQGWENNPPKSDSTIFFSKGRVSLRS